MSEGLEKQREAIEFLNVVRKIEALAQSIKGTPPEKWNKMCEDLKATLSQEDLDALKGLVGVVEGYEKRQGEVK